MNKKRNEEMSPQCKEIIHNARVISLDYKHYYLAPEHILLSIIQKDIYIRGLLNEFNITAENIKKNLFQSTLSPDGLIEIELSKDIVLKNIEDFIKPTRSTKKVFELAHSIVVHRHINPLDLIFSIIKEENNMAYFILKSNPKVIEMFNDFYEDFKTEDINISKNASEPVNINAPTLEQYAINLTKLAKERSYENIFNREAEIESIIEILCRKNKSNPCLVGFPGVGKTAIIEGFASRVANGNVPAKLKDSEIYSLDLSALIGGAKYRGMFEDRLNKIVKEIENDPRIILFIDEVHNLASIGTAEGSVSGSEILKPALARGSVKCIGATTNAEYISCIEKDGALARRFNRVFINESSNVETKDILMNLKKTYEEYHAVEILDEAINGAVDLAERYITDKYFPDKALDLIDIACSRSSIKASTKIVTLEDIKSVISIMTKIPVTKLDENKTSGILTLKENISRKVMGQEAAIASIYKTMIRAIAGFRDFSKPIASFIFTGSTGVGKTESAIAIANTFMDDKNALIRIDMSEYMEKASVSRLVGASPGYVGYEEGGQLTEAVRRNPYSVVLFDEIEKAHPDVVNIFLQILDYGRLTDNQGRVVDFRNTIIIFTSNLYKPSEGKRPMGFPSSNNDNDVIDHQEKAIKSFSSKFSPEFINRVDDIVVFENINESTLMDILDSEIEHIKLTLKAKEIDLLISNDAKSFLIQKSVASRLGARNIKKIVSKEITSEISILMLSNDFNSGDNIEVNNTNTKLIFKMTDNSCVKKQDCA